MTADNFRMLCRYHYDPLDRLAGRSVADQAGEQCFYLKNRLTTEIQGHIQYAWLQTPNQLLAQQRRDNAASDCALIATDLPGSVIQGVASTGRQAYTYTPYGSRHPAHDPLHLPGFNRERADPVTGHYLLGNGYRAFNPLLMRFNSPDSLSPFGAGGLNAYGYCVGDPVNRMDPTGHLFTFSGSLRRFLRRPADPPITPSAQPNPTQATQSLIAQPIAARQTEAAIPARQSIGPSLASPAELGQTSNPVVVSARNDQLLSAHAGYAQRRQRVPPSLQRGILNIPIEQRVAWNARQPRQSSSMTLPPAYRRSVPPPYPFGPPPPYVERDLPLNFSDIRQAPPPYSP